MDEVAGGLENCIKRSFIISNIDQISVRCSSQEELVGKCVAGQVACMENMKNT
jgi:hypothetical protein